MGAGPDVPDTGNRRAMTGLRAERPPEEVLVQRERAPVRVASDEVHVGRLEVCRGECRPSEDRGLEVRDMSCEPGLDPVGVALPQILRPFSAADVDLAGSVALDPPRQLLQLDPEESLAPGRP